ncbi:SDR family oxidoreductase [Shinella sp.]|uniref:LacI family DNA-binding transcriptional regulator n=1 Tax=Shinella sp. TaxID=1870904 RepID=UPI003F720C83
MTVTIKDIARRAGVSTATVSKVLNRKDSFIGEETRQRVWALARELNYTPNSLARSLVMRKSHVIGIIVPDILNPYFTELVRACDDAARLRGYTTLACNTGGVAEIEASRELADQNITVNMVSLGWIPVERHAGMTPERKQRYLDQVPMKRFGSPEDIAHAVAFLASDRARFITGQRLTVNGGRTFS